jgi:hypothetical protein
LQKLAANLRPDAARAAGDQQHAVVDPEVQFVDVQLDRLALQQVFDRHGARVQIDVAVQKLLVAGQHLDDDFVFPRVFDQLANLPPGEFAGRDQHLRDSVPQRQLARLVERTEDRHAADVCAQRRVAFADKTDDAVRQPLIAADRAEQRFAGIVGADDQDPRAAGALQPRGRAFVDQPEGRLQSAYEQNGQAPVEQQDATRQLGP